jgi:hypothetical protein
LWGFVHGSVKGYFDWSNELMGQWILFDDWMLLLFFMVPPDVEVWFLLIHLIVSTDGSFWLFLLIGSY